MLLPPFLYRAVGVPATQFCVLQTVNSVTGSVLIFVGNLRGKKSGSLSFVAMIFFLLLPTPVLEGIK